jgi:hypothetical protein
MKMKTIRKKYAENWQENETSIVLKMLDQAMKDKDAEKMTELKRSLLEIERKSVEEVSEVESPPFNGIGAGEKGIEPKIRGRVSMTPTQASKSFVESFESECKSFSLFESEYLQKVLLQNTKQFEAQIIVTLIGSAISGKTSLMNSLLGFPEAIKTKPTKGYILLLKTI